MSDDALRPLTDAARRTRGFCTCPQKVDVGPSPEPCRVHPDGVEASEAEREETGLVFFDDRRSRFVAWPDAVEGMRQRRYAGAVDDEMVQFTWVMLIRLLEALRDPLADPADEITPALADDLVAWSGATLPVDDRRALLVVARGGSTFALTRIFRDLARRVTA